jgi:hypothetical protein
MALQEITSFLIGLRKTAHDQIDAALKHAYERGVADGKRLAAEELSSRIANVLNYPRDDLRAPTPRKMAEPRSESRSPRGSVEPRVIEALSGSVRGKKIAEISTEKDIPENSVRGMLNKLRHVGVVEKHGELWLLVRKDEPAGTPSESAPTGSLSERLRTLLDQPTAQGREAGLGGGTS